MKRQLMIVEDCFSKYMVTKQIFSCSLHMPVKEIPLCSHEMARQAASAADRVIVAPKGGAEELLAQMRKQNVNRRNTEVTLILLEQE